MQFELELVFLEVESGDCCFEYLTIALQAGDLAPKKLQLFPHGISLLLQISQRFRELPILGTHLLDPLHMLLQLPLDFLHLLIILALLLLLLIHLPFELFELQPEVVIIELQSVLEHFPAVALLIDGLLDFLRWPNGYFKRGLFLADPDQVVLVLL